MKKLILSLLKSAVGKAIIQIIIDAFLKALAKKVTTCLQVQQMQTVVRDLLTETF